MSKQDSRTPFVPEWLPDQPFQVGVTQSGEAVWADPKDFAETPDIKQERKKNHREAQAVGTKQECEKRVYAAALAWLESRLIRLMPAEVYARVKMGGLVEGADWLHSNGFTYDVGTTGDTYKVVLLHKGTEISRFVARRRDFQQ